MFSAGMALWHGAEPPTRSSDQIVARADKAPYQTEQTGHNRVLPAGRRTAHLTQRSGGGTPTLDVPITRRMLGVDLDGSRRIGLLPWVTEPGLRRLIAGG
jgi:hypothetical protein